MGDSTIQDGTKVSRYVPIDKVRRDANKLVKHYGGMREASEVTGIPYRTLQGILQKGKLTQVTRKTAMVVTEAAKNPPQAKAVSYFDKRYVEAARVQPLAIFLEKTYGNLALAAEATGIPEGSLRNVRRALNKGVDKKLAERIVQVVLAHRRPRRSIIDTYEEDYVPRYALPIDKNDKERVQRIIQAEKARYGT